MKIPTKKADGGKKYMCSVKIGPKGQIVIPKDVRDMFNVGPGDSMLLLADAQRGIAIQRIECFDKIADEVFRVSGGAINLRGEGVTDDGNQNS